MRAPEQAQTQEIAGVILAAGKSSRMKELGLEKNKTALPGPDGKSLIVTAVELFQRKTDPVVVVIGSTPESYPDSVQRSLAEQEEVLFASVDSDQSGTGHSFATGVKFLANSGYSPDAVVLGHGDNLMRIPGEVFDGFIEFCKTEQPTIGLVTAMHPDPTNSSAGKITHDEQGNVTGIVEKKDATQEQKEIPEINFGLYFMSYLWTLKNIDTIPPSPATGEIYATELVRMAIEQEKYVQTYPIDYALVGNDVNTPADYQTLLQSGNSATLTN